MKTFIGTVKTINSYSFHCYDGSGEMDSYYTIRKDYKTIQTESMPESVICIDQFGRCKEVQEWREEVILPLEEIPF